MNDQDRPVSAFLSEPSGAGFVGTSSSFWQRSADQIELPGLGSGYTLRQLWGVLGRRRLLIFGCVGLLTLAAVIVAFMLPKRYVAESLIILDTRRPEIAQYSGVLPNLVNGSLADPAIVRGEVALITSPAYERKVIEHLNLLDNPVFQSEAAPSGWTDWLHRALGEAQNAFAAWAGRKSTGETTPPMGRAIEAFSRHLSVYSDDRSYAIGLRYEARDPKFATSVINALAELYISDQVDIKRDVVRHAGEWLNTQVSVMQAKLSQSEHQIADFKEKHHLETVISGSLSEQRMLELNRQVIIASGERMQKQAVLSQIQNLMKSPGGVDAAAQVLASPLIQRLREQQSEAEAQVAGFKGVYGNLDDRRAEARAKEIGLQLQLEVQRIATSLSGDVSAAQAREDALRESLRQQQVELDSVNTARVELTALEREANATRAVYDSFLLQLQQVETAEHSQQADARIVPAELPTQPSSPNKPLIIGFGFFGSLFLGLMLGFTAERFDETIRTPADAERLTGAPVMGFVPRIRSRTEALSAAAAVPLSAYSDAVNNILVMLRAVQPHGRQRVIALSSALPGEGKTWIASALARASAMTGCRTLLIDCDFRRPAVGPLFDKASSPGLDAMYAQKSLDLPRFVVTDQSSGLHYLATHEALSNPREILGSQWMTNLILRARDEYDLILLDTPPLLVVADALLLSAVIDTALLVVQWARTPGRLVVEARKIWKRHSGCGVGIIVSQVNMRQYRKYCSVGTYYSKPRRSLIVGN
jgi:polysaccharide biosynthesis transport protein